MKIFLSFLLSLVMLQAAPAMAQGGNAVDEALAAQYFNQGEFEKAAMLYKKLLDGNMTSVLYYDSYITSLLSLKNYDAAEKEIKRVMKRNGRQTNYLIDLGFVLGLQGEDKKSIKAYDEILSDLIGDETRIQSTAMAFMRRDLADYAIKTYEKGRRLLHDELAFALPLAKLHSDKKNYNSMFEEYMRVLDANPYEFETVKDHMQEVVMQDEPYEIFKKILLKKVQAQPDNTVYSEMLSWLYVQRKDFTSALIQTKSIDRRLREGGRRLVELARIAANYKEYEIAEKAYMAVTEQGESAPSFMPARRGLLDIRYTRITEGGKYTQEDINNLISSYNEFLTKYGMGMAESGEIVLRLAEVQAQYNKQVGTALTLLKEFLKNKNEARREDKPFIARARLALGDYSVVNGEVWDATLYYGLVEKMYKDDPLGHEAKYRNAKLSFYRGEFEWAKAQLDVLKSSTSELIANDAMQLSLLIQDNLGLDTTEAPLKLYAEADLLIFKNLFDGATAKLDTLNSLYPNHALADEVLMARATIATKMRDYTKALEYLEKVYTTFSQDILADDAMYKAAWLYDNHLDQPEKARELYEKLMLNYQGSVYVVDARNRFRKLRGDAVN